MISVALPEPASAVVELEQETGEDLDLTLTLARVDAANGELTHEYTNELST